MTPGNEDRMILEFKSSMEIMNSRRKEREVTLKKENGSMHKSVLRAPILWLRLLISG